MTFKGDYTVEPSKASVYKRNYLLLVLEGSCFMGGTGFINSSTVVPVFINMITHSKELVGLTLALGSFFTYFGRLLIGPFLPHVRNHARFAATIMFICRPLPLLIPLFVFSKQYELSVVVLVITYSILWLQDGLVVPSWSEVLANTVDSERHGRLLGMQMLIGGVASIGAGILVNVFLNNPALDTHMAFGLIFLLGALLLTASCFAMAFAQNAPHQSEPGPVRFRKYYSELPGYLKKEKDNTRMLGVQFLLMVAGMCIPFIILFSTEKLRLSAGVSAQLIIAQSIGSPVGGWLWGQICDRWGCRAGMKLAGVNILLISVLPLLALFFAGSPLPFILAAMFLAGVNGGVWTCYYVYTVQVVRPESRPACMVLASVVTLPATLSSYLAGFIAERFGYAPLFALCAVIGVGSIVFSCFVRPVETVVAQREAVRQDKPFSEEACETRVEE